MVKTAKKVKQHKTMIENRSTSPKCMLVCSGNPFWSNMFSQILIEKNSNPYKCPRVHAMNFFFTGRMAKRMLNKYRCHLKTVFFNICPYQIKTTTLAWKQPFLCVPWNMHEREIMRPMFSQDFSTICGFAGSGRLQQHSVSILNKSSRKQTQGKENNLQGNGFEWI